MKIVFLKTSIGSHRKDDKYFLGLRGGIQEEKENGVFELRPHCPGLVQIPWLLETSKALFGLSWVRVGRIEEDIQVFGLYSSLTGVCHAAMKIRKSS